jgi:iron complex outermembrane receptor protein
MNRNSAARFAHATRRHGLRFSPVAAAVTSLLWGAVSAQAQGSDAAQTVTVTGIRHAIESSIATKREADSIIEAVSAEDIGKLPDTSIADSIARLPGLAAQRIDGRPSAISIRGLGPDYAGAVLNGRQVVSSGDGRAAEYDQFPSELVNQVIVYKTPDAALIGQGLSGTIDIRPVMPLELRGRQVVLNARLERNSNGALSPDGKGAMGNRFSASYIDQFADNTVGLAIGFAHLDAPGQEKKYEAWRYGDYVGQWGAGATGVPAVGSGNDRAQFAQGFESSVTSSKQVRDGLMAVLEWKPNKDLHSVVDLYYSKFEQDRVGHHWVGDIGLWSGPPAAFSNVGTTVVDGNTIIASGTVDNGHSLVYDKTFHRTDEITSVGWKNELKLADKWTGVADICFSRAQRDEKYIQSVARPLTGGSFSFSGLDSFSGGQHWTSNQDLTNPASVQLTNDPNWAEMRTPTYRDEIKSLRLSGKRDLEWGIFSRIDTGLAFNQRDKNVRSDAFNLALASANVAIPAGALGAPVRVNVGGIDTSVLTWNVPAIMGLYSVVPKDPWSAKDNKYAVHEKVTTAFAKLDVDAQIGSVPVRGNMGVQAVRTQQNSDGFAWNDPGGTPGAGGASVVPVSGGTTYNDFLPSVNLVFQLAPDLVARMGLAKTMARPRMDDLRAGADQPKLVENAPGSSTGHWVAGNGGKPDLKPWRAQSLDLSLEKYISKTSYLAVAGFYKKLDTFIYQQDTVRDFSGFPNYSTTLVAGCGASKPDCNPNLGTITTQDNGSGGKVYGLELSASLDGGLLTPALQGFGLVASESVTRNSLPRDKNGNKIYLDGFSGIVNSIAVYYEQNGFSARVSQRYRSPFTATTRSVLLGTESNTHIDAEKQVDFQMGYAFENGPYKNLSLLLQVNNWTNAPAVQRRSPEVVGGAGTSTGLLPWKYDNFGRSVLLGGSYKF